VRAESWAEPHLALAGDGLDVSGKFEPVRHTRLVGDAVGDEMQSSTG
jgi:hypothetical protein